MIRKTAEIDIILLSLNQSIDAHYKWLVKMFRCVVSADITQPEISNADSHCLCEFGKWLNNHPARDGDETGYLYQINAAHAKMHASGRVLLLAIVEKRWLPEHFEHFQNALLAFTAAVTDYKIYLLNIRSNMDILTGLPGRRVLDESFDRQLIDASPFNLYLFLLDIDRFKSVNDTYGHLVGDVVLRTLAANLAAWARHDETAYRYGGEEFIIIIRAQTDDMACQAGMRICHLIAENSIQYPGGEINITVTGGVTRAQPGEPLDVVLGRSDQAMYEGKQTGRNRCMFMDEQHKITRITRREPVHQTFTKQVVG
ncbi:diguanylate cyclase [Citrobacter enshiensis]|uniref:diguanylate cyclase n=1 Tax=Citrobacter enshiensis TaxID=2971264 RepID=A0ABT8PQF9_9ENTR|nr:diguanylate cyclase [Citrobacter enshiensis]MDN8598494.1 diguanylate cyclase [Citrobacter enshiensis]WET38791.1 diguanylate cyclase [Citrobacter enshiensis]